MGETTKLSREHTVANPVPGLVLVAGGKLTTYRIMARDAVDHAIRDFDATPSSITDRVPLMGAWGHEARTNQRVALSRASGLEIGMIEHGVHHAGDPEAQGDAVRLDRAQVALGVELLMQVHGAAPQQCGHHVHPGGVRDR